MDDLNYTLHDLFLNPKVNSLIIKNGLIIDVRKVPRKPLVFMKLGELIANTSDSYDEGWLFCLIYLVGYMNEMEPICFFFSKVLNKVNNVTVDDLTIDDEKNGGIYEIVIQELKIWQKIRDSLSDEYIKDRMSDTYFNENKAIFDEFGYPVSFVDGELDRDKSGTLGKLMAIQMMQSMLGMMNPSMIQLNEIARQEPNKSVTTILIENPELATQASKASPIIALVNDPLIQNIHANTVNGEIDKTLPVLFYKESQRNTKFRVMLFVLGLAQMSLLLTNLITQLLHDYNPVILVYIEVGIAVTELVLILCIRGKYQQILLRTFGTTGEVLNQVAIIQPGQ